MTSEAKFFTKIPNGYNRHSVTKEFYAAFKPEQVKYIVQKP